MSRSTHVEMGRKGMFRPRRPLPQIQQGSSSCIQVWSRWACHQLPAAPPAGSGLTYPLDAAGFLSLTCAGDPSLSFPSCIKPCLPLVRWESHAVVPLGTPSLGLVLLYQALFDIPAGLFCTSSFRPVWWLAAC